MMEPATGMAASAMPVSLTRRRQCDECGRAMADGYLAGSAARTIECALPAFRPGGAQGIQGCAPVAVVEADGAAGRAAPRRGEAAAGAGGEGFGCLPEGTAAGGAPGGDEAGANDRAPEKARAREVTTMSDWKYSIEPYKQARDGFGWSPAGEAEATVWF